MNTSPGTVSLSAHTLRSLIDMRAETTPHATFLVDPIDGNNLTFAQLHSACRAFSSCLSEAGFQCGDSIAYALQNGPDAVRVILGSLYGGYLATAVNLIAGSRTIGHVLEHSEASAVVTHAATERTISPVLSQCNSAARLISLNEGWFGENAQNGQAALPSPEPESAGLLMYTSGTTGVPKGVVHSHRSLIAGGANTALAHQLAAADRALCVLPLYHINGLCVTLMGPLVSGGCVVMPDRFSVSAFWPIIRDHRCTWVSLVPTQISYLLHEAETNGYSAEGLDQLRFGRSASAPLAPDVQQAFERRFAIPVIETMGLTETAAQILSNPLPPAKRKIGSPGIPFGNDVIIADEQQRECRRGQEGEVLVRGENVMRHYRNNESATASVLTGEGWLRTGDLGRMDDDGYVFITGRLKELIIKGGENIAPREIDEALYAHPDIIEAAAFARQCSQYGETVEAAVMVRKGSELTERQLIALCTEKIGVFKSPDRVHFLAELPKGPSGKIQRLQLAELTG